MDKLISEGCWNRIGVWGRSETKCPLLSEVIHCHNCEVFHEGSQTVFRKELPQDYCAELTRRLAEEKQLEKSAGQAVIVFRVANEWMAFATRQVREIAKNRPVQRIPHNRNAFLAGIVNISGEIDLCFSLRHIMKIDGGASHGENSPEPDRRRLIVAHYQNENYIFVADEIGEVRQCAENELLPLPDTVRGGDLSFMRGMFEWRRQRVGWIDHELLFSVIARSLA
ncbi:MAG: chemotaxis protein CheW [Pseudomonadota bacterium]